MLNDDYKDILRALSAESAKFLLVGAYAMAIHGYVRATADFDLWVMPSPENAEAVFRALENFGAPLHGLTTEDLQKNDLVFQIGVTPRRIDIMTGASGLTFEEAFKNSIEAKIDGFTVRIPSITDLIQNKRASGRAQDIADADALQSLEDSTSS